MGLTIFGARHAKPRRNDLPSVIQNILNDRTIEFPFPVYILQEFARYISYSEIRALGLVSKRYFKFIINSTPLIFELDAGNCLIGGGYIPSYPLSKFINLHRLVLSHNFIDSRSFAFLKELKFLEYLDISYNTGRLPGNVFLAELSRLRTLIISGNYLRDEHLIQIQRLTNLEHLEIAEFRTLTAFPVENLIVLTSLKTLNLAKNYIGSKGLKSLCRLPNLLDLNLSCCTVTVRKHLSKITTLTRLDLSATALGFERVCLSTLTNLIWLDISYNLLDDDELKNLALPASIQELNIASTGITNASFPELMRLANLVSIYIHANPISAIAIEKYSQASNVMIKPIPRIRDCKIS